MKKEQRSVILQGLGFGKFSNVKIKKRIFGYDFCFFIHVCFLQEFMNLKICIQEKERVHES